MQICKYIEVIMTIWTGKSSGNSFFQHSFQPKDNDDQNGLENKNKRKKIEYISLIVKRKNNLKDM